MRLHVHEGWECHFDTSFSDCCFTDWPNNCGWKITTDGIDCWPITSYLRTISRGAVHGEMRFWNTTSALLVTASSPRPVIVPFSSLCPGRRITWESFWNYKHRRSWKDDVVCETSLVFHFNRRTGSFLTRGLTFTLTRSETSLKTRPTPNNSFMLCILVWNRLNVSHPQILRRKSRHLVWERRIPSRPCRIAVRLCLPGIDIDQSAYCTMYWSIHPDHNHTPSSRPHCPHPNQRNQSADKKGKNTILVDMFNAQALCTSWSLLIATKR